MRRCKLMLIVGLLAASPRTPARAAQADEATTASLITPAMIEPRGERYLAIVPNTLDLAERGRLSVRGLTRFLNPRQRHAPYGQAFFNVNPPFMSQVEIGRGEPSWGKIAESLIKARLTCGSRENLDIEREMLEGMLADRQIASVEGPTATSRAMHALSALYQVNPDPALRAQIEKWLQGHIERARQDGDARYFFDGPEDPYYGYIWQAFVQGTALRVITQWADTDGDPRALEFAGSLARHVRRPRYWNPEAEPRAMAGAEHGHFAGHHHSYLQALMGLAWHGAATGDEQLKEFARAGYEYMRGFGLASIGVYGEGCTTGDMTQLALKLCDAGVGDYWEDVDRYVRNHLAELQITDADKLRGVTETLAPHERALDELEETRDDVINRNLGAFLSDATHPTLIPAPWDASARGPLMWTICCTGNCTPAMYHAWESIVRCADGKTAQVNLLLNRASPWLDVDSYLPYEGRVVIRNKTARMVAIRMPRWVDKRKVKATLVRRQWGHESKRMLEPAWVGQCMVIEGTKPGDRIGASFPVEEREEKYTLKWPQSGFWTESTKTREIDKIEPIEYTMKFRGNTLVDIQPRNMDHGYPLYQRDAMRTGRSAPMHEVERFVAERLIRNDFTAPSDK